MRAQDKQCCPIGSQAQRRRRRRGGQPTTIKHCCTPARMQNTQHTLACLSAVYSLPWWFFILLKLILFFHFHFDLFLPFFFLLPLASFSPLLRCFPTKTQIQHITPILFPLPAFHKDLNKNWTQVRVYSSSATFKQKEEPGLRKHLAASKALKASVLREEQFWPMQAMFRTRSTSTSGLGHIKLIQVTCPYFFGLNPQ